VLPNILTINGDGCNDTFRAFGAPNPDITCPIAKGAAENDPALCARFVKRVDFTVYNRWGQQVYEYHSGRENTIYINWDGQSNDGAKLSSGIYYYLAEVEFDVVDPKEASQQIKGWLQIIR
ncbi:MAG: gliding motility-associated C-terminal domain-containing protein, partial [Fulvivirga sp.]|nr:gliding motility-associated C-terminal domain-containing protein [Fulvivirga sp.]